MKTPAERIIARFGSMSALAKALGHRNVTTVQGWKQRGVVPLRQISAVIEAGRKRNLALTADDFLDAPSRRAS